MSDLDDILREEYNKLNGLNSYGMPIRPRHIFSTDPSIELNKPTGRTWNEEQIRSAFEGAYDFTFRLTDIQDMFKLLNAMKQ